MYETALAKDKGGAGGGGSRSHKDYFETVQTAYAAFDKEDMVNNLTVPVHPGAELFWKEIGLM